MTHLCANTLDSGINLVRMPTYISACGKRIEGCPWYFPENTTCEECKKTEMWKRLTAEKIAKRLIESNSKTESDTVQMTFSYDRNPQCTR